MRPFALFYHVWCSVEINVARFLVDEQIKRMIRFGLHENCDIYCCVSGQHYQLIQEFITQYEFVKVLEATPDEHDFEGLTLLKLFKYCEDTAGLRGVAYIHTKGIQALSGHGDWHTIRAVNSWRHLLEWGTLDNWKIAVQMLSSNDAVGVNFRLKPWPHFGGNFWWATPSYIRGLNAPIIGHFPEGDYSWTIQTGEARQRVADRLNFERWIGINNPAVTSQFGFPFFDNGVELDHDSHNLYLFDIYQYASKIF